MWIFFLPQENHSKYFSSLQSPHTPPLFHSEQISPLLSFEEHNHCSEFLLSTQVSAPCRATLVSLLRADPPVPYREMLPVISSLSLMVSFFLFVHCPQYHTLEKHFPITQCWSSSLSHYFPFISSFLARLL